MNEQAAIRAIVYARPREGRGDLNEPFDVTLEEALAAIASDPRGFAEPDGSFSLRDAASDEGLDGEVYDFAVEESESRVHHVDVRGSAGNGLWRRLFAALSPGGAARLLVFLPESGESIKGDEFLRLLTAR